MNSDRDHALLELTRRNPFWVCLLVFAMLAADSGYRLVNTIRQRRQLDNDQLNQAQQMVQMSGTLQQLPQLEARLQALSLEVIQVAKTNATAAQIVRDFKIEWTPGPESFLTPPPVASPGPASQPATSAAPAATVGTAPATNAPAAK